MRIDKLKIYVLEILLIIFLFFALFASNIINRSITALILFVMMIITVKIIKPRGAKSIYKRQISFLMFIFSLAYLGIFYLIGLNTGFVKSKYLFSFWTIRKLIIPLGTIIVSSEIIRQRLISQELTETWKNHKFKISNILIFISMVLVDIFVYNEVYDMSSLDNFLTMVGFVIFASISCNLLYNYMTLRFGASGIIIFRLITVLFFYIFPYKPDFYILFRIFLRILYPYIIYIILERSYTRTSYAISYAEKRKNIVYNSALLIITALLIMLISCKFTYGILVIGSRSMTGSINIGDAVVYKEYNEKSKVKTGDVIIFHKNGIQTVHRINEIKKVNDEYRIYTKGDANSKQDSGYITPNEIIGKVKFKIKYIGYPTLWIRKIFNEK